MFFLHNCGLLLNDLSIIVEFLLGFLRSPDPPEKATQIRSTVSIWIRLLIQKHIHAFLLGLVPTDNDRPNRRTAQIAREIQ